MSESLRLRPRTKAEWSMFSLCIYLEHVHVHYPFYLFKYLSYTYCIILLNHLTVSAVLFLTPSILTFLLLKRNCVCVVCIRMQVYVLMCALARGQRLVSFFPP